MRRAFSILFVLLFGLAPLGPILDGDDPSLPACCRRHGEHHCAMSSSRPSQARGFESEDAALTGLSHCPMFPQGNANPSPVASLTRSSFTSFHAAEHTNCQRVSSFLGSILLRIPT